MTAWDVLVVVAVVLVVETVGAIAVGLYMQHFGANRQTTDPDELVKVKLWNNGPPYDQDDEPPVRSDTPPDPPPPERKPMIGLE